MWMACGEMRVPQSKVPQRKVPHDEGSAIGRFDRRKAPQGRNWEMDLW